MSGAKTLLQKKRHDNSAIRCKINLVNQEKKYTDLINANDCLRVKNDKNKTRFIFYNMQSHVQSIEQTDRQCKSTKTVQEERLTFLQHPKAGTLVYRGERRYQTWSLVPLNDSPRTLHAFLCHRVCLQKQRLQKCHCGGFYNEFCQRDTAWSAFRGFKIRKMVSRSLASTVNKKITL